MPARNTTASPRKSWKLVVDRVYEDYYWRYNETSHDYEKYVNIKAYDFVLREEKDHVVLPNLVHVRVNPVTGAIVDYWGVDRFVTVGLKNTVSLSEAMETAEGYYRMSDSFTLSSSEGLPCGRYPVPECREPCLGHQTERLLLVGQR